MRCVLGDVVLGLHGDNFSYLFSYAQGGPESFVINGKEWLYRAPKPTFWRATTCNDRGNRFSFTSAMWMGADLFSSNSKIELAIDGKPLENFTAPHTNAFIGTELEKPSSVVIAYTYETATSPSTKVKVSYHVQATGTITIHVHYVGKQGLPDLPAFGLRFILPTTVEGFTYQGLGGETYPDRKKGAIYGMHEVKGLPVTPYLVPQECGMHMDTELLTLTQIKEGHKASITFAMQDKPFAFSALPYTAIELESAPHQEELPPPRRTVLSIFGGVRGVGGIDSWGSDVEEPYHIPGYKDIEYSFVIKR